MRTLAALLLVALLSACSTITPQAYIGAGVADTVSTGIALQNENIIEGNPAGFALANVAKVGIYLYAQDSDPDTQALIYHTGASIFTGAAVNNLLLALGAVNPVAPLVGLITGIVIYNTNSD